MAEYDLGTARGKIEIDSSGVEPNIGRATAATDNFTAAQGRSSESLLRTGTVMLGAAAVIGGGFAIAINASADFEERISAIAAVSGSTGAELDSVRAKALQLGADTKYSAGEAATAMEELIKAGLSVPDVLNGAADATVNLAAAGEIALPEAATIAANAMNQFGLSAAQMPHVADLIAGAANASAIDVGQFGQAMTQAGAVANLVGVSFDDMTLAIAAMGNAGITGGDAGTSLKSMLMRLQPQTESQATAMRDLGLITADGANKFFDASGKIKSMSDISAVLGDTLAGMTEQQKTATLQTLFGSDAIRAAAIIADTGAQGFDDLATSIGKVSAQDVAAKRMDNLKGSIEQLKGSVETMLIIVGKPLADALRGWVDGLTGVINWVSALDPGVLELGLKIAGFAGAVLGAVGGVLAIGGALGKLEQGLNAMKIALAANPFILFAAVVVGIGVAFYQAYQNIKPFHDWVDANLLPLLDTLRLGVEAMIAAFTDPDVTSDGFVGFMEQVGVQARMVWDLIVNQIIPAFNDFWTVLTTGFTNDEGGTWFEDLAFHIRDAWQWVNKIVDALGGWKNVLIGVGLAFAFVLSPIGLLIGAFIYAYTQFDAFHEIVDTVIEVVTSLGEWLIWLGGETVERVVSGFAWLQDNVFPVLMSFAELVSVIVQRIIDVFNTISPFLQIALDLVIGVVTTFIGAVTILWDAFGEHIWNYIQIVFDLVKGIVEGVLTVIQGIINTLTGLISGDWEKAWNGIKDIFSGIWDIIRQIPETILEALKELIPTLIDGIKGVWEAGWKIISDAFVLLWDAIKAVVSDALSAIWGFISDSLGEVKEFWDGTWDAISSKLSDVWDAMSGFVGPIIQGISDTIHGVIDPLAEAWGALWDGVKSKFESVWNGMKSTFDTVVGAIKSVWNGLASFWNSHNSIDFGGFDNPVPGLPDVPGFTLSLPDIPTLDVGGLVTDPTLAALAMNSVPEIVSPVPFLESMFQKYASPGVDLSFTFNGVSREDIPAIKSAITSPDVLEKLVVAARSR